MIFAELRDQLGDWTVAVCSLSEELMGYTDPDTKTIWISSALTENQHRSTLMHEVVHALRGDRHHDPATEASVRRETARRLIPIEALVAVFTWASHPDDICDALRVDHGVLRTRLRNLTEDELSLLRRGLGRTVARGPIPDQVSGMCLLHQWWVRHQQPHPAPAHVRCVLDHTYTYTAQSTETRTASYDLVAGL